jgi:hypothetical protein
MRRLAIISTALLVSGAANATTFKTGNQLLEECRSVREVLSKNSAAAEAVVPATACMLYIAGANDALDVIAGGHGCAPTEITMVSWSMSLCVILNRSQSCVAPALPVWL